MTDDDNNQSQKTSQMSRRDVLKNVLGASAAVTGSAILGGTPSEAEAGPLRNLLSTFIEGNFRIDVHCHHIPDFYRQSLADYGITSAGGVDLPSWSPEEAVKFMNLHGIQTQVVSISEPGVYYLPDPAQRKEMAWRINDYTNEYLIHSNNSYLKNRFGGFAVLPIGYTSSTPDIDNACREAERAINVLGMEGVGLYSNYNGTYLGDPSLDPLMETLNDLGAMVFVHPVTPQAMPDLDLPTFLFEFPFDTTRAVVNLTYKNVLLKYPNIRWLLAHAGGTIPFLAYRTSLLRLYPAIAQNLGLDAFDDGGAAYAKLFYDTALSPAPTAMKSVREVTEVSHIMFASDWPFSKQVFTLPGDPAPQLEDSFNDDELRKVLRDNALDQFPQLKQRLQS